MKQNTNLYILSHIIGPGIFSVGVRRPGRRAKHSPLSSVEANSRSNCTAIPLVYLHGVEWNNLPFYVKQKRKCACKLRSREKYLVPARN